MRLNPRWVLTSALLLMAALGTSFPGQAATKATENATEMMNSYDAEQRAAATARAKDPAWKPSCKQINLIQVADAGNPAALKNFCLNKEGEILACFAEGNKGKAS